MDRCRTAAGMNRRPILGRHGARIGSWYCHAMSEDMSAYEQEQADLEALRRAADRNYDELAKILPPAPTLVRRLTLSLVPQEGFFGEGERVLLSERGSFHSREAQGFRAVVEDGGDQADCIL